MAFHCNRDQYTPFARVIFTKQH